MDKCMLRNCNAERAKYGWCARHWEEHKKECQDSDSSRKDSGLCLECDSSVVPGNVRCERHRVEYKNRLKFFSGS